MSLSSVVTGVPLEPALKGTIPYMWAFRLLLYQKWWPIKSVLHKSEMVILTQQYSFISLANQQSVTLVAMLGQSKNKQIVWCSTVYPITRTTTYCNTLYISKAIKGFDLSKTFLLKMALTAVLISLCAVWCGKFNIKKKKLVIPTYLHPSVHYSLRILLNQGSVQ